MWTGERSVVYVKNATSDKMDFMMRMVTLGTSLGDSYLIKEGLEVGEEIATNGTFSIDAAAQLAGKPSMMNPEGGASNTGHNHGGSPQAETTASNEIKISKKAKAELSPVFDAYLKHKNHLVADNFEGSISSVKTMETALNKVDMKLFKGEAHTIWMKHSRILSGELNKVHDSKNIGELRIAFRNISDQMIMLLTTFGAMDQPLYIEHCPMVNNNEGADWISSNSIIENPYYGAAMLKCGEVKQIIK
jgi:Cu(I)/Ag(I) efflux system membrane fusion protein